ncbi:MAG TPA: superoxide dismutase family protein [Gemmatimonadaceae bacterium]|nr:superoxide dismutase family protein [Gemmatimonadaceae bacterium]
MILPRRSLVLNAALMVAVCTACATTGLRRNAVAEGVAVIYNVNGAVVGTAQLWQESNGLVNVDIASLALPPGTHGIHFHAVGMCDGGSTAFSTAGAHYNPLGREHGLENPNGPHAGDAPNIVTPVAGFGRVAFATNRVRLTPGTLTLFDPDGSAIVVHANPDDQMSQPAGNSGARIACGVVRAIP